MTANELMKKCAEVAPLIGIDVSKERDYNSKWDVPDKEPPADMDPYIVTVTATAVVNGKRREGIADIADCWMTPTEEIGDIGGYLPQKIDEALDELRRTVKVKGPNPVGPQITALKAMLKQEMKDRWQAEQDAKKK